MAWDSHCLAVYEFENNLNDSGNYGKNATATGTLTYSNTIKKYGDYSVTTSDPRYNYFTIPDLGSPIRTLEMRVYFTSLITNYYFFGPYQPALQCDNAFIGKNSFQWAISGAWKGITGFDNLNTWYGYAVKIEGSSAPYTWRIYTTGASDETYIERTNFSDNNLLYKSSYTMFYTSVYAGNMYLDRVVLSDIVRDTLPTEPLVIPTIAKVSPNEGDFNGGTLVTIYGQNFSSNAQVYFDNNLAVNITYIDSNTLTCYTPAGTKDKLVDVKVVTTGGEYTKTNAYLYVDYSSQTTQEIAEAELIVEKENVMLNATITGAINNGSYCKDGIYAHYNVDTGQKQIATAPINNTFTIDFGTIKTIKKITFYFWPVASTYFGSETTYTGTQFTIQYWDGSTWQNLMWDSFNNYLGIGNVNTTYAPKYYCESAGIVSIFSKTGITTNKLNISSNTNLGITEITACDLLFINPTNIRISDGADVENLNYNGMEITAEIIDSDFSCFNGIEYGRNAYLKVKYRGKTKYFGQLKVTASELNVADRILSLSLETNYKNLELVKVSRNAITGTMDIAKAIEWLILTANIHRDLVDITFFSQFNYFPEQGIIAEEITKILELAGDANIAVSDGLLKIRQRTSETPTFVNINDNDIYWGNFVDNNNNNAFGCSKFQNDFVYNLVWDKLAPVGGFTIAESYSDIWNKWKEGRIFDALQNVSIINMGNVNHYALRLSANTGILNFVNGAISHRFGYENYSVFQFSLEQNQGTVKFYVDYTLIYPTWQGTNQIIQVDTTNKQIRVVYEFFNYYDTPSGYTRVYRTYYDETNKTIISRDWVGTINLTFFQKIWFKIHTTPDGTETKFKGFGFLRGEQNQPYYKQSVVYQLTTTNATRYNTLDYNVIYDKTCFIEVYTKSNNDISPVQVVNNLVKSVAGNTLNVIFLPKNFQMLDSPTEVNFTIDKSNWNNWQLTNVNVNWSQILLFMSQGLKLNYFQLNYEDIERGIIQVYPRQLIYKNTIESLTQSIIFNKLNIAQYKYNTQDMIDELYDDKTEFIIYTVDYEINAEYDLIDTTKPQQLYIKVNIASVDYEYTYSPCENQYEATPDWYITYRSYGLGAYVKIHPASSIQRTIKEIKISAYQYHEVGKTNKIYDWLNSQKKYGILEKKIDNKKINDSSLLQLIYLKYNRFLNLPTQILGDGITTDINLDVDLMKYVKIYDEILNRITNYKVYEYEMTFDIINQTYEMILKGRSQSYEQY